MSIMNASSVMGGGLLKSLPARMQNADNSGFQRSMVSLSSTSRRRLIQCEAGDNNVGGSLGMREAVDKKTKVDITKDDILRNQNENESEKRSVFGGVPSSGSFYPRPEIERRPETGDRSLGSLFSFDGAAPETINGRLAMLGSVWALVAEKGTGLSVAEQPFSPLASGLVNFVGVVQIFTFASLIPLLKGESTDARQWGLFNAKSERWNGPLAMLGFAALLLDEAIRGMPFISTIHY